MFIADAWADFSWIGVLGFAFIAGAFVKLVDLYAFRNGKTDESIAIMAGIIYSIFIALSTSLTTSMLTGGLLTIPFLSVFIYNQFRLTSRSLS